MKETLDILKEAKRKADKDLSSSMEGWSEERIFENVAEVCADLGEAVELAIKRLEETG